MARAIGFDYGSTTSIITRWVSDSNPHAEIIGVPMSTDTVQGLPNNLTPKQYLSKLAERGEVGQQYRDAITNAITSFTRRIFQECKEEIGDVEFITLTYPQALSGPNRILLQNAVAAGLRSLCPDFDDQKLVLLPEPVAAALYFANNYCQENTQIANGYVLTCDVGGGTADLALVKYYVRHNNETNQHSLDFEVLDISSSNFSFGGRRLTNAIYKHFINNPFFQNLVDDEARARKAEIIKLELQQPGSQYHECQGDNVLDYTYNDFLDLVKDYRIEFRRFLEQMKARIPLDIPIDEHFTLLPVGGGMKMSFCRDILTGVFNTANIYNLQTERYNYNSVSSGAALNSACRINGERIPLSGLNIRQVTSSYYWIGVANNNLMNIVTPNESCNKEFCVTVYPTRFDIQNRTFQIRALYLYETPNRRGIRDEADRVQEVFLRNDGQYETLHCPAGVEPQHTPIKLSLFFDKEVRLHRFQVFVKGGGEKGEDYLFTKLF